MGLSKFIAGGEGRVGADANIDELAELGATVIDLTDVKADDSTNHDKFAQLAEVAPELRAVLAQGIGDRYRGRDRRRSVRRQPLRLAQCRSRCSALRSKSPLVNDSGSASPREAPGMARNDGFTPVWREWRCICARLSHGHDFVRVCRQVAPL